MSIERLSSRTGGWFRLTRSRRIWRMGLASLLLKTAAILAFAFILAALPTLKTQQVVGSVLDRGGGAWTIELYASPAVSQLAGQLTPGQEMTISPGGTAERTVRVRAMMADRLDLQADRSAGYDGPTGPQPIRIRYRGQRNVLRSMFEGVIFNTRGSQRQ